MLITGYDALLGYDKTTLPSVPLRFHGEVDPVAASLITLNIELIIVLLDAVGNIQEDSRIAYRLL